MAVGTPFWGVIEPKAATNIWGTPSFEDSTAGTGASLGNGTLTRVAGTAAFGAYAIHVRPEPLGNSGAQFIVPVSENGAHAYSVYLFAPVGGTYVVNGFVGTAQGTVVFGNGDWQRVSIAQIQSVGNTSLIVARVGDLSGSVPFLVDGVQFEVGSVATTYLDGDQDGCVWLGNAHQSRSERSAQARAGGIVRKLGDLGFVIEDMNGVGVAPQETTLLPFSLFDGGEFQEQRLASPTFSLDGMILGTSQTDLHAKRQRLEQLFLPQTVSPQSPVRLSYDGGRERVVIDAIQDGGLDYGPQSGFAQDVSIRFTAPEPYWRAERDQGTTIAPSASIPLSALMIRESDGAWGRGTNAGGGDGLLFSNGSVGTVFALLRDGENLYATGTWGTAGAAANTRANARWRIPAQDWRPIGGGADVDGFGLALARQLSGSLVIAGAIITFNNGTASDLAVVVDRPASNAGSFRAIGTTALNSGSIYAVREAILDRVTGVPRLFAGGTWSNVGSSLVELINGTWIAVGNNGTGINGIVFSLGDYQGSLALGGSFVTYDLGERIAFLRSGSDVAALPASLAANGLTDINTILKDPRDRTVFVGSVTAVTAGGVVSGSSVGAVALQGGGLYPLGVGVDGRVFKAATAPNGDIVVVGKLGNIDGVASAVGTKTAYAVYAGNRWQAGDLLIDSDDIPFAVETGANGQFFIGGALDGTGTIPARATLINRGGGIVANVGDADHGRGDAAVVLSVENYTTQSLLGFNGYRLQPNETLTINTENRTITSNVFGNQLTALRSGASLAQFGLITGTNTVGILTTAPVGSLDIAIYWRPTSYAIDGGSD